MSDFHTELRQRAHEAQRSLAQARSEGDDHLVEIRLGEMESLARLAAEHHITLDGIDESLAAHGLPTPAGGMPLTVDLDGARVRAEAGRRA